MSWPTPTLNDALSGKGAKTFGENIFDRANVAAPMSSWVAQDQNVTTTLQDELNAFIRLPVWAVATATLTLTFTAWRDGAVSGDANFRLRARELAGSWVNGSTLTTAITTARVAYEVTVAVPASPSWAGQLVELGFQAQRPASGADGDWHAGLSNVAANLRVGTI